jgi:UDP-N-acetylmuramoyl-tripeptide--D-alanyl-D-alanine ligase
VIAAFTIVFAICFLASSVWHLTGMLHFLQLHEYLNGRFFPWALQNPRKVVWLLELIALPVFILLLAVPSLSQQYGIAIAGLVLWGVLVGLTIVRDRKERKAAINPLVMTQRASRLLAGGLIIVALEMVLTFWLVVGLDFFAAAVVPARFYIFLIVAAVVGQLAFANMVLANWLLFPVEESFRRYYVITARKRLREINPVVIGITGSYGKTTTKEVLSHILSARYGTLKTPKSYNTLMGICKVIREDLRPEHEYFVVEMGAYKKGEIAQICRLVKPSIGIVTAIGPQHLERFKIIDRIIKAKSELLQALPDDGVAVLNADDPACLSMAPATKAAVRKYGVDSDPGAVDVSARQIVVGSEGTQFEIVYGDQAQAVRTVLLGRHNVSNILGAALAALESDVPLRTIAHALSMLPTVEHRLQLVKGPHGVTYIDDSYNSNPKGSAMALEVLAAFPGRKFVVTTGFVELGSIEDEEDRKLGREAAAVGDYIFLVGLPEQVEHVHEGIQQTDFDRDKLFLCESLNHAREHLRELVKPGDVILFENDLGDIYY